MSSNGVLARRAAATVLTAAATAAMASAAYQCAGDRRDRRRFPPPGEVLRVPGHGARHVWRHGAGRGPTVVVVACLGGPALEWTRAAQTLAERDIGVLLYDRAGLGWSPARRGRVTSISDMVDELTAVLDAAGLDEPVLLVGHSIGGIVARQIAARTPRRVAGLVMVDSSHEDMTPRLKAYDPQPWWRPRWPRAGLARLRWLGLRRLAYDLGRRPRIRKIEADHVPESFVDAAVAVELSSNTRRGDAAELAGLRGLSEIAPVPLGDLPLWVITAGPGDLPARQRWYPEWERLQAEIVALSTRGRQVHAPHADHHVHHDDLDLVVSTIAAAHAGLGD